MLAVGMAVLTLALDGSKGTGLSSITLAALVICGVLAIALYLKHAHRNPRALFSLNLFRIDLLAGCRSAVLPDASAAVSCRL